MTESELIELVQTRTPEELSPEEIRLLAEALPRSAALREALAGRLEIEQCLHARLGNRGLTAEQLLARSAAVRRSASRWSLGLAAVGAVILASVYAAGSRREPTAERPERQPAGATAPVSAAPPQSNPPPDAANSDSLAAAGQPTPDRPTAAAGAESERAGAQPPAPSAAIAAAGPPAANANPALEPTGAVAPNPPVQPAPAPEPVGPWKPLAEIAAQPAPDEAALAGDLNAAATATGEAELRRWLAEIPGQQSRLGAQTHWSVSCGTFAGILRLQSPWSPAAALRMSLFDFHRLRIHLWNGRTGVTLHYLQNPNRSWVAYRATRKANEPLPDSLLLADVDEGRNARVNVSVTETSTFDLRCDGKALTLGRRDIPFVRVPFDGMPTEVVFDGKAMVRQMQLVRAVDYPAEPAPGPVVVDLTEPAKETWRTDLPDGATFRPLGDGRVELTAQKTNRAAWASLPLAADRIQEVILELDDPQPGAGVFLGDASGKSNGALAFYREQRSGRLVVGQGNPSDHRADTHVDPQDALQAYCSPKPWVKLLVGCGVQRFWISDDGEHWARCCDPWTNRWEVIGSVGLYCAPGQVLHGIRLRRLVVRELPALSRLAPLELRRQAPVPTGDIPAGEWLVSVCRSTPAGIDPRAWRRACAIRTLAANATPSAAPSVLDHLVDEALADPDRSWNEQLDLLTESSSLRPCWDNRQLAERAEELFVQVGCRAAAMGRPEALAPAIRAELTSPLWARNDPVTSIDAQDQRQLLQLAYSEQWREARALSRYFRLTRRLNQDQEGILDWADSLAPRQGAALPAAKGKGLLKPEWRHPLIAELSKEAYNVLAELQGALEGKAYRDACQIISTAGAQGSGAVTGPGLLPDARDADLLLSFPQAVRLAMREHPPLATTMNEQFGAAGRLRVRQAIADEDAVAVEAAALQFFGSAAAAQGRLWLADRALASGAFAQALANYDECLETGLPETQNRARSGAQLALAMLGRPALPGAAQPAEFGDVKLTADQFAGLLDELRGARASEAGVPRATAAAPGPGPLAVGWQTRLDGDSGENPQNVPSDIQQAGVDWIGRQCAFAAAGERLIVSNRFQVSALDVKNGQIAWRSPLGAEQGGAHDWSLSAMRPLVVGDRLFVRRLTKGGPRLAALTLADGKPLWITRAEPDMSLISDPVWIQEQLFAVAAARADQEYSLSLVTFDPASGALVRSRPLLRLRDAWGPQRSCEATAVNDGLVIACGGSVLRVDVAGRIAWLRRELWTPGALDRPAGLQVASPPIVRLDRAIVSQPGVREVACLDATCGRLLWKTPTPALVRVVGLADRRLIVQTEAGLAALSADDGQPLWERPLEGLLEGMIPAGGDAALVARAAPLGDGRSFTPTLVWIDLATGAPLGQAPVAALRSEAPRLGPLAVVGGRLLALSGRGNQDPTRDVVELAPEPTLGGAAPVALGGERAAARSALGAEQGAGPPAELALWRGPVDPALREAVAETFPEWILLAGPMDRKQPPRLEPWQGETGAIEAQAAPGRPFVLARWITIPAGGKLAARVASDAKWKLEVTAGSQTIVSETLDRETTGAGWKDLEWPLDPVAGQTVWLIVRQIDIDGSQPLVKWKSLDVR